ncbi:hypothetical protein QJU96_07265 [Pasteurella skyensis]|uniref:Uncharacterized protein n=1 Tax=Phocoenobacter skyensis TaxID=97481 RepID=A0AAJ6P1P3_9PAST|nr:hypothetical protein [Pasteurella skyensis]MDP8171085.1 hypothetical protein [Pasteurella skyensis]MDP8173884.1 hypothetical protein [Pasteurella skyensis]
MINMMNSDKFLKYLEKIGVDTEIVKENIRLKFHNGDFHFFINDHYQLLSPNIYINELVFTEICKYAFDNYKESMIFEDDSKFDIKTTIATSQSLIQRPSIIKPCDTMIGFKEPEQENDFVRIARFEIQRESESFGKSAVFLVFEGLLPIKIETNPLADIQPSTNIWSHRFYVNEPVIQGFCHNLNSIEFPHVLWLNSGLLEMLNLKIDNYKNGLQALNSKQEIVLKFRHWRNQLIGNGGSFVGIDSNIAKLEGCDLMLRADFFKKLKNIIPNLIMFVKTI